MTLCFADTHRDVDRALAESRRLDEWIEAVLSARPSDRARAVSGNAEAGLPERGRDGMGRCRG
jgi:ATP-dependent RNA helicase SUPV3L1/SUV3